MGEGVNIAARLEGIADAGAICLSEDAYRQVKGRLDLAVTDLGQTQLKNIADPVRVYSLQVGMPAVAKPAMEAKPPEPKKLSPLVPLVVGIVALVAVAGGTWYFLAGNHPAPATATTPTPAQATHLSIVVLPFANLSGDASVRIISSAASPKISRPISRASGATS